MASYFYRRKLRLPLEKMGRSAHMWVSLPGVTSSPARRVGAMEARNAHKEEPLVMH